MQQTQGERDGGHHIFVCGMSRSGTTLMTTILDSHPDVSMGYELLPAGLPPLRDAAAIIRRAAEAGENVPEACRTAGHASLGGLVKRAGRTRTEPDELAAILERIAAEDPQAAQRPDELSVRTAISVGIAETKRAKESTRFCGFKLNAPSVEAFDRLLPRSRYVFMLRDPRDVYASHVANDFGRSLEHVCRAWVQYTSRFLAFMEAHPEQAFIIRYEDLVSRPDEHLARLFGGLGLSPSDEARRFFQSKASIHGGGHLNAEQLGQDFFTSSTARWLRDLSDADIAAIQKACGGLMRRLGYHLLPLDPPVPAPAKVLNSIRESNARRKVHARDHYADIVSRLSDGRTNLTWAEAAAGQLARGEDIFILRHDVDHDIETAQRMAEWEAARGVRATYCILHTARYYGPYENGRQVRYRQMIDACLRIQELGHEINLHNNFTVLALQTGRDPLDLMQDELMVLRRAGVRIVGSSTHGDALCRELDFRNYELFSESVYASRGGRRTIAREGCAVELGATSMSALDLAYEAYDIPRDLYVTDSGGTLRVRRQTRGRAGLRRSELPPSPYASITGLLTHPIWWDMQRDAGTPIALEDFDSAAPEDAEHEASTA